jgi:hypothetical protein
MLLKKQMAGSSQKIIKQVAALGIKVAKQASSLALNHYRLAPQKSTFSSQGTLQFNHVATEIVTRRDPMRAIKYLDDKHYQVTTSLYRSPQQQPRSHAPVFFMLAWHAIATIFSLCRPKAFFINTVSFLNQHQSGYPAKPLSN